MVVGIMCLAMKTKFCLLCFLLNGLCSFVSCAGDAAEQKAGQPTKVDFGKLRDRSRAFQYDEAHPGIIPSNDTSQENVSTNLSEDHNKYYHSYYQLNENDIHTHTRATAESKWFIMQLFDKYGQKSVMSLNKFALLLKNLGLNSTSANGTERHLHSSNSSADDHHHTHAGHDHIHNDHHSHPDHEGHHDHDHGAVNKSGQDNVLQRRRRNAPGRKNPQDIHDHSGHHDHSHVPSHPTSSDKANQCLNAEMLLSIYHLNQPALDAESFLFLCPAVLYQLDSGICRAPVDQAGSGHVHSTTASTMQFYISSSWKVWICSVGAVLVISLVGLLGVAVIPLVQRVFFNHLLQFLVALAVGALSGDALLHLLPHAMVTDTGHDHHDSNHSGPSSHNAHLQGVWKGLCGLIGIFLFFLMERILTIISSQRRHRKSLKSQKTRHLCNSEQTVGDKLSDYQNCEERLMNVHPNKEYEVTVEDSSNALTEYANENHEHLQMCEREQLRESGITEEDVVIQAPMALGHSHSAHHHSHHAQCDIPKSVAAVAWMVILGDGIHNFSDGLAIGASFANSLSGGLSTSIAVFCHELPHEIGDFALLLRAGMSAKQAIVYNCVSSFLCFFGMIVGVMLGNLESASLWVFAAVGGMFLYIALVDMLPEVTSMETKAGENPFFHLLFQSLGMLLGAGIMLIIAVFEDDLSKTFQGV